MNHSKALPWLSLMLALTQAGCDKSAGAAGGSEPAKDARECGYKSKGFCLSPPAGFAAKDLSDPFPGTEFEKPGDPEPTEQLRVTVQDFEMPASSLKTERDSFKTGAVKVLEEGELEGGKGFFVVAERTNNVMADALLLGAGKTFRCHFNAYLKDRDAMKEWTQACKSLRFAD